MIHASKTQGVAPRWSPAISLIVPAAVLLIWQVAVTTGWWPDTIIATPSASVERFVHLLLTRWPHETKFWQSILLHHALWSSLRLLVGFAIGSALGIGLGILCGTYQLLDRALLPTLRVLSPVPPISWIPLLIVILGIGEGSKISLIAAGAFFVVFFDTFRAIRQVDAGLVELATIHGKSRRELVLQILLPASASTIFGGLRLALALGWILLVAAEIIASADGLGWLMQDARNFSRPADLVAGIIAVGFLGAGSDRFLLWLEDKAVFWNRRFEGV